MSATMLTLDGEPIPLDNMKLGISFTLADTDVSGKSSQSDSAEEGNKAMELKVSGMIRYDNEDDVSRLFELARKTEKNGSRHQYRIGNSTARAVKVRLVKFAGDVSLTEQDTLFAWQVSFSLREVRSVAEQQELRAAQPCTTAQTVNSAQFSKALADSNKVAL